jgi:hypothetical protein
MRKGEKTEVEKVGRWEVGQVRVKTENEKLGM